MAVVPRHDSNQFFFVTNALESFGDVQRGCGNGVVVEGVTTFARDDDCMGVVMMMTMRA